MCGTAILPLSESQVTVAVVDESTNLDIRNFTMDTLGRPVADGSSSNTTETGDLKYCKDLNMSNGDSIVRAE